MKGIGRYALAALLLIAVLAAVLNLIFPGDAARTALIVSGVVGLLVQVVLFAVVRLAASDNLIVAWGVGTVVRFVGLIVYAFVIAKTTQLELGPALVGLATFFFACTLLEPHFLKK